MIAKNHWKRWEHQQWWECWEHQESWERWKLWEHQQCCRCWGCQQSQKHRQHYLTFCTGMISFIKTSLLIKYVNSMFVIFGQQITFSAIVNIHALFTQTFVLCHLFLLLMFFPFMSAGKWKKGTGEGSRREAYACMASWKKQEGDPWPALKDREGKKQEGRPCLDSREVSQIRKLCEGWTETTGFHGLGNSSRNSRGTCERE